MRQFGYPPDMQKLATETVLKATAAMPQAAPVEMPLVAQPVARPQAAMHRPVQQQVVTQLAETLQLVARPQAALAPVENPRVT